MLLSKDWQIDPRVRKEVRTLTEAGYDVAVLDMASQQEGAGIVSTVKRLARFQLRCLRESRKAEFDVVHAHDFDTLMAGVLIAKLKGVPLVYDAHESYSHMVADKVPEDVTRIMNWIERKLTKQANHIILANEKIGPLVSVEPQKWVVVMNCPGELNREPKDGRDNFTLGYFGSLERGRFIQGLIDAVKMVDGWQVVIAGKGSLKLDGLDDAKVKYLGHVHPSRIPALMGRCDLLSVMFEDGNANDRIGTPNRLFEAMALGIPVVANGNSYSGEITRQTDCGFTITPKMHPLTSLLQCLAREPEKMKQKGNAAYEAWRTRYNWETQETKLIELYNGIAGG